MRPRIPTHLTDAQLLEELKRCVRDERGATATLVAHLAETDARNLHLGFGHSSLFSYCCDELGLSESATCKRIDVARAARRFPVLLDRLVDGSLSLSSAHALSSKLTPENLQELIGAAVGRRKRVVEEMLARRFPKPDVVTLVRKLPTPASLPMESESSLAPPAVLEAPLPVAAAPVHVPAPPRPLATPLSADRYQIRFTASAATWKKLQVARDLL